MSPVYFTTFAGGRKHWAKGAPRIALEKALGPAGSGLGLRSRSTSGSQGRPRAGAVSVPDWVRTPSRLLLEQPHGRHRRGASPAASLGSHCGHHSWGRRYRGLAASAGVWRQQPIYPGLRAPNHPFTRIIQSTLLKLNKSGSPSGFTRFNHRQPYLRDMYKIILLWSIRYYTHTSNIYQKIR